LPGERLPERLRGFRQFRTALDSLEIALRALRLAFGDVDARLDHARRGRVRRQLLRLLDVETGRVTPAQLQVGFGAQEECVEARGAGILKRFQHLAPAAPLE